MSYTPKHLGHLVMRVRDMERSLDFYTRVMGLTIMERSPSGTVFMSANTEKSHELAIRAIGMDAGGPDHSIVGQAHMAWQMETFEDLQELYDRHAGEQRAHPAGSATTASRWAYTCWTRTTTRSRCTTRCPPRSGSGIRRRASSVGPSR